MALPPDGDWYGWSSEQFQQSDDAQFNEWVFWDPEPPVVYDPPSYIQAPSTLDDRSTTVGSEMDVPPLTLPQTHSTSTRSEVSPFLGPHEDSTINRWLGPSTPDNGVADLTLSPLDFQHMGGNPEIQVQESLTSPPNRICLDDLSLDLSSTSPSLQDGSPSQLIATPMRRGRSNPLPEDKRAKAKDMRRIKACSCQCRKKFPGYPEVCDRGTLSKIRFPDHNQQISIWPHNTAGAVPHIFDWQSAGSQGEPAVTFDQTLEESSRSALMLQAYVAGSNKFLLTSQSCYAPPPFAIFGGSVPMSTAGNWPGTYHRPGIPQSLVLHEPRLSPDELLRLAEAQVKKEFDEGKGMSFCAAVGSLLLAYRANDSAVLYPPPVKWKQKQSNIVNTTNLVCKVVKMLCWWSVWRSPALYCPRRQFANMAHKPALPTPAISISDVQRMAIRALDACEREVLFELDELPPKLAPESQGPVWACLWQMILTYHDLIKYHPVFGHGPSSGTNLDFSTGICNVPSHGLENARSIVVRLYCRLVTKYVAHFSSRSSPVFHKHADPRTRDLLPSDEQLRLEWANVLRRREAFYRTISSEAPSDAFLKTLVIDMEHELKLKKPI
ncbi:hypothetical protein VPNG_00166 [Cytospora leucostoma]|uniref:Uncharacterized protein n=1 Tax=Cytospora leucostoma TaxID=1230097 RepID=A0A423XPE9_9PEZI|nr:hypothetical protein VPNG_00166 [Cytospora leucostoma]